MSPAEQRLWFELRSRKLEGTHFRRQAVLGPFVVDFASHGARLVIELDGGVENSAAASLDDARAIWLTERGYKIMRFANARVLADPGAVAEEIFVQARARLRIIHMMRECDPFEVRPD